MPTPCPKIPLLAATLLALLALAPCGALAQTEGLDPPDLLKTIESGYLAHRRGDYDEAIAIYSTALSRRGLTTKQRAVTYLLRGEAKRDKGDILEGVYDFTRALRQWPNYPQAVFFRGQALAMLDRQPEALKDLTRAVELDPSRESYNTNLLLLKKKMQAAGLPVDVTDTNLVIEIPKE
ncbi:MAG: tetratricopeptide repeat protein [Deltaproteobacteria bacterium]|jgi:tetratricopeptide (TPR) repeat protein|nr:tetratricopeptide repeat protein [Deltaproteobacteria bacterium]